MDNEEFAEALESFGEYIQERRAFDRFLHGLEAGIEAVKDDDVPVEDDEEFMEWAREQFQERVVEDEI